MRNGHKYLGKNGYFYVKLNGKYLLEHRVVLEKKLGRKLLSTEVAHHENEIKTDNRPENIGLIANNAEHQRHHNSIARLITKEAIRKRARTQSKQRKGIRRMGCIGVL